jgi:putative ABC transport system permease protein
MLRNYLKLAFRNLTRQKAFSIINVAGLAIGLASSLTILLWVRDELNFDRFHAKADRTYRVTAQVSDIKAAITPSPLVPALEETSPEVQSTVRLKYIKSTMMQAGEKKFEEKQGFYTEPSLFDVFDFKLQQGDVKTALVEPNSIVLTRDMAIRYFGSTDALGKIVRRDNKDDFTVTGILAEPEGNSHLRFDYLLPWSFAVISNYDIKENSWGNFDFYSYIAFDQSRDQAFISGFEQKIDTVFKQKETRVAANFKLQPLTDIHLHSDFMADVAGNGNFQHVTIFTIVAVFILLIGCINFMNLSTARATRRAKEVGLRKVAGAVRTQLVRQFLGESVLISAISLAAALVLAIFFLPTVNELTGKQLRFDIGDPMVVGGVLSITLVTGLLAGLYPAFILSAFTPIKVLKGIKGGTGGSLFRNVLVVSQFVISIFLLAGTTVVYQQLQFIRERDLGYNKENLLHLQLHGDINKIVNTWRAAFESDPATSEVTIASGLPTNLVSGTANVSWQGKDPNKQILFATLFIDENFIPVYEIDLVSGRNFKHEMRGDSSNLLINQAAARAMGFTDESAIGQPLELWHDKGIVVGVVKDFNFKPLKTSIEPMLMRVNRWEGAVVIKAEANRTDETIKAMKEIWNRLEPIYPFSYGFVDEDLQNMYSSEKRVGTLFTAFAILAIFISCLGLYGLSMYVAEQRTREIGIRKALGASVGSIVYLLNTRFVIPIIAAMIIASPLAWYTMNKWLEGFAYRVNFNWLIILIAGMAALLVSLLTVSYETFKAAKVNPVKSLRTE